MDDALTWLKSLEIFKRLPEDDLRELAGLIKHRELVAGEVLFRQGDPGDALFIIVYGQLIVRVINVRGMEQVVAYLRPGQYLGETSLVTGEEHDATVQALEPTALLVLRRRDFEQFLASRPHVKGLLQVKEKTREKLAARDFPGLAEGEVPLVFKRKHWIVVVRSLLLPALVLLLSLGLSLGMVWIARRFGVPITARWVIIPGGVLAGLLALWATWNIVDWFNDHYIVTNKRVIHIEKVLFFYEERREAPLSSVQNVNVVTPGPVASFLKYDDLMVETAGGGGKIVFAKIPHARQVREIIFEQTQRARALAGLSERTQVREGIRQQLRGAVGQDVARQPPGPPQPQEKKPEPRPEPEAAPPGQATKRQEGLISRALRILLPPMWDEEKDRITWRKHWLILFRKAWLPLLGFLGLLALLAAVLIHRPPFDRLNWQVELAIVVPFVLAVGFGLWFRFEDWKNDIYVVTDNALLDIEKLPLGLREESKQASLGMVQDVSYTMPHPIAQLFNFGHVFIETAGPTGRLTFHFVSRPREVQREIFRRMEAFKGRQQQQESARRWEELTQWFGVYHELVNEQPGDNSS